MGVLLNHKPLITTIMKESQPNKAEKCGICFFVNNKAVFTLVKTRDEEFNESLLRNTYLQDKKTR